MSWKDQAPEATDVIAILFVPDENGGSAQVEIDYLEKEKIYRATAGNLFISKELYRNADLEVLLRRVKQKIWKEV